MQSRVPGALLFSGVLALAGVLLLSSLRTFRALEEQRATYLRSRVAALAAQLEQMSEGAAVQEPGLIDMVLLDRAGSPPELDPLWRGLELFRTEEVTVRGERAFRAWVPFAAGDRMRIARLDLAWSAADFLVTHAWRNLAAASVAAAALIVLSLYGIASARRAARLEHLAQLGEMSAVLAHEIRNPLGTIKGFAQLIEERSPPGDRALIEPILAETSRLENLVKDLLLYGRPPQVHLRSAEWAGIREALSAHAAHYIGSRDIEFSAAGANLVLYTDPGLLQQALLNLTRNAIEAIPEGRRGHVSLSLASRDGRLRIEVADDGTGLAPEVRANLFRPFRTTKAFGTGLGLAVTRKLVEALGGRLTLEDRRAGGTSAVMDLPHMHGTHSHR